MGPSLERRETHGPMAPGAAVAQRRCPQTHSAQSTFCSSTSAGSASVAAVEQRRVEGQPSQCLCGCIAGLTAAWSPSRNKERVCGHKVPRYYFLSIYRPAEPAVATLHPPEAADVESGHRDARMRGSAWSSPEPTSPHDALSVLWREEEAAAVRSCVRRDDGFQRHAQQSVLSAIAHHGRVLARGSNETISLLNPEIRRRADDGAIKAKRCANTAAASRYRSIPHKTAMGAIKHQTTQLSCTCTQDLPRARPQSSALHARLAAMPAALHTSAGPIGRRCSRGPSSTASAACLAPLGDASCNTCVGARYN
ncbi:hypothetical protein DFH27DRAFT_623869 [Peziza echinospora]|nr:hypothetical protein DFH27DRAFT_623869 [Peziza echinospora]